MNYGKPSDTSKTIFYTTGLLGIRGLELGIAEIFNILKVVCVCGECFQFRLALSEGKLSTQLMLERGYGRG